MFINTKHAMLPSKVCSASKGMYQKRTVPYFIFPSTFVCTSSFLPFGALLTDRQRNFFTPALFPKSSFFPLSARHGALPTHRRNSTGLAELLLCPELITVELKDLAGNDVAAVAEQVLWGSVLFRKTH